MANKEMEPVENSPSIGWCVRHPIETFLQVRKSFQEMNMTYVTKCCLIDGGVMLSSAVPTAVVYSLKGPTPESSAVLTVSMELSLMAFGAYTYRVKQMLEGYNKYCKELLAKSPSEF